MRETGCGLDLTPRLPHEPDIVFETLLRAQETYTVLFYRPTFQYVQIMIDAI